MTQEPVKVTDLKSMETALTSPDSIGDEVALKYWGKEGEKYFADIVNRMVNYVCSDWPEDDRADMRHLIMERKFMPNTPCWMNAGTELKSLAACFVLPLEDSMDSIFTTVKNMAMVLKEGGGVGISLSKLRPENSPVKKTKGVSSGPISFLKVFDAVVDTVKQGGARRGAAMANLRVDHPDILKFIRCKEKEGSISNFNISVAITDSFVSALTNKTKFLLQHNGMVYESIDPNIILDAIAESSWKNGEPGIQFIDTVNRSGLRGYCAKFSEYNTGLEVSNPCGETYLLPNESCILGALNVYKFVRPFWIPGNAEKYGLLSRLNLAELIRATHLATKFLNSVIDKSEAPLPEINKATRASRKIGLGVMGLADMLSAVGTEYGSSAALDDIRYLFKQINNAARDASKDNATLTLVAPTGTTGVVAGVSGGIEPHFRVLYDRNSVKLGMLKMLSRSMVDFLATQENDNVSKILRELDENGGKFPTNSEFEFANLWKTSDQLVASKHMDTLEVVQSCVDNSVSKTINLPYSATKEEVRALILDAYRRGVKGFTVYRDGSREEQVLYEVKSEKSSETIVSPSTAVEEKTVSCSSMNKLECECASPCSQDKRPRPSKTHGDTTKVKIGCGSLYVTVNSDKDGICEVFTSLGRSGGCPSQSEATARLISLSLRSGIDVKEVIDQLKGIRCLSTIAGKDKGKQDDGTRVLSCPDAIGKNLELVLKSKDLNKFQTLINLGLVSPEKVLGESEVKYEYIEPDPSKRPVSMYLSRCPECCSVLTLNEGCRICTVCGYSKCG